MRMRKDTISFILIQIHHAIIFVKFFVINLNFNANNNCFSGTLNIADYVTGVSGLSADLEVGDVTPIATQQYGRRRFIPLLYGNDGNIKFTCNINPTSRDDWNKICTEFSGLTGGLGMWFEIIFPGDTDGYFFRGEPCPMQMPDFNAGEVVQGDVEIIESDNEAWQTKVDVASA